MTEFKKGGRVRHADGREGTVIAWDNGCREVDVLWDGDSRAETEYQHLLTKIPRFEDVRTGDKITVETEDYTITGTAKVSLAGVYDQRQRVQIEAADLAFYEFDDGWHDSALHTAATLTAHTPAEPEWHRAKVIKADYGDHKDEFWVGYCDGQWVSSQYQAASDDLTNVTIIVDRHGQVRAS